MLFWNHKDFKDFLQDKVSSQNVLLGLDIGSKTIGLALSDRRKVIASSYKTLQRKTLKQDLECLKEEMNKHNICAFVMGWPLHMNGDLSENCIQIEKFAKLCVEELQIPIFFLDERLSTYSVNRLMIEADYSRKKRAKLVDMLAANYILQNALGLLNLNN